jgi:hypothetical protein
LLNGRAWAADAEARLLGRSDLNEIAHEAAMHVVTDDLGTIETMLAAQGMSDKEVRSTSKLLATRMEKDIRAFVSSLDGVNVASFEDAERIVAQRRLVLRFSALNSPNLYAKGRPLSYSVNDAEVARLERSLLATWIEREPTLRKKLEEMAMMNEISHIEATAVRKWVRELAMARGKRTISEMRGAQFFSSADADYYLECAVSAEIERVRGEKLSDPVQRPRFLEEAMAEFGAREEGAPVEVARSVKPNVEIEEPKKTQGPDLGIDFNK